MYVKRHKLAWITNKWVHLMTKPTKWNVRPAKTQISLGIRAQWVAKDPRFLHKDSEDSDQTGQMPRMIWVSSERTCYFLGLSRGGSTILYTSTTMQICITKTSLFKYTENFTTKNENFQI